LSGTANSTSPAGAIAKGREFLDLGVLNFLPEAFILFRQPCKPGTPSTGAVTSPFASDVPPSNTCLKAQRSKGLRRSFGNESPAGQPGIVHCAGQRHPALGWLGSIQPPQLQLGRDACYPLVAGNQQVPSLQAQCRR
jgi:hypothetical protein